jgi:hypothetical protein
MELNGFNLIIDLDPIIKMLILLTYSYKQLFTTLILLLINLIPNNFIIIISLALSYSLYFNHANIIIMIISI